MTTRDLRVHIQADGAEDTERRIASVDKAFDEMARSAAAGAEAAAKQAGEVRDLGREQADTGRSSRDLARELDALERDANAAARAQRDLAAAGDDAGGSLDRVEGKAKSARAALSGISSGLLGIAAAFGASKLLEMGEEGGALQNITRRLQQVGISAEQVTEITNRLGGGSVADVERLVTRANEAGVSFDAMGDAADAALAIAKNRGLDAHEVMGELTKSLAAGEVGYLRQLGVVVDVAAAQRNYAKELGVSTAELTEQQKVAAASAAAYKEINDAFGGGQPDKYASNLGAVRDAFTNINDEIKRMIADSLSDLGAMFSGGFFNATFASKATQTRLQQIQKQIADFESIERRLVEARASSLSLYGDEVLAIQDQYGEDEFRRMLGLPEDTEITRFTAKFADILGNVRRQLEAAREQEMVAAAAEDYAAALKEGEGADKPKGKGTGKARPPVEEINIVDQVAAQVAQARALFDSLVGDVEAAFAGIGSAAGAARDIVMPEAFTDEELVESERRQQARRMELIEASTVEIDVLLRERMLAELAIIEEQYQREREIAELHNEDMALLEGVFDQRRTASREKFAKMRIAAEVAEYKTGISNARAMIGAVGELADAANASEGAKAIIKRLAMLADAADSFAEAAAAGPAAPAFIARGIGKLGAAVLYQDTAAASGRGGGGGGSAPSIPTSTSAPGPGDLPARQTGGPTNIGITVDGSLFLDRDGMTEALRDALSSEAVGMAPIRIGRSG